MIGQTALNPRLHIFHARANAAFIAGTSNGEHVLAKSVIPGIQQADDGMFEIIFRGDSPEQIDAELASIVSGRPRLYSVK